MTRLALIVVLLAAAAGVAEAEIAPLTVDQCVERALGSNGKIAEADARVAEWRGRLAEARTVMMPRLVATGFAAPMFRVQGSPVEEDVQRDYSQWGPYLHFEAMLTQPLYTFGRAEMGARAAQERTKVEEATAELARNAIAAEVRRFYYLHLYAKSMRPLLAKGRRSLDEAMVSAQREYDEATGRVTNVDLQKLAHAASELARYEIQAEVGEALAFAALQHVMGMADGEPLRIADEALPPLPDDALAPLATFLVEASAHRPEWAQIEHGRKAALSLEEAERLANLPVVFAAGQLSADWTPMRPDAVNPYAFDPFNRVAGGVAVGLQFDFTPGKAAARGDQAVAMREQVDALARFAKTGIPLEVRKAWDEAQQADRIARVSSQGASAARKWLVFAGAALASGTGEAKDVLEGLAAHLQSKRTEYEAIRDVHLARGQLAFVVGKTGP